MEGSLRGKVSIVSADRAGAPGPATLAATIDTGRGFDMADAHGNVVTGRLERIDWTGREAGLRRTGSARRGLRYERREVEPLGKDQRAAVRVPKPKVGMNEEPDWGRRDRFGPLRPALKGKVGWPVEREQRLRLDPPREAADDALDVPIERVGSAIFGQRSRGRSPQVGPGVPDED